MPSSFFSFPCAQKDKPINHMSLGSYIISKACFNQYISATMDIVFVDHKFLSSVFASVSKNATVEYCNYLAAPKNIFCITFQQIYLIICSCSRWILLAIIFSFSLFIKHSQYQVRFLDPQSYCGLKQITNLHLLSFFLSYILECVLYPLSSC